MTLPMKLQDWIDIHKLDWFALSSNPKAIELLIENPKKIDWCILSINHSIITLMITKNDRKTLRRRVDDSGVSSTKIIILFGKV